mmetsp:Transcript_70704/g.142369  ORF Transcript_70704/g.142369 Transcript_70704/m.142369 type:complete len:102 (+) Transcript_70704:49-354(+)
MSSELSRRRQLLNGEDCDGGDCDGVCVDNSGAGDDGCEDNDKGDDGDDAASSAVVVAAGTSVLSVLVPTAGAPAGVARTVAVGTVVRVADSDNSGVAVCQR